MKQLTRKQLQNDLDAAKKREEILYRENEAYRAAHDIGKATIKQLSEERDDWRFAFKAICKAVERQR